MPSLSTEIIAHILSRLPVKSLIRCTSVCKSWYSLIKTPNFIKLHLKQTLTSYSDCHLVLCGSSIHSGELDFNHADNKLSFSELDHPLKFETVIFHGSCNGVVCISDLYRDNVFLYNPLTKSCRKLPINHVTDFENERVTFGFGYDSKTDDYKVFRLFQRMKDGEFCYDKAEVYSLRNSSWRCVKGISYSPYFANHNGVLVNETLHYIVYTKELGLQRKLIGTFDFKTETFSYMDCPNYDAKYRSTFTQVSALGGCLCLLINYYSLDSVPPGEPGYQRLHHVDLWVMKEYGKKESWVRLFNIRRPQSIGIHKMIWAVVYSKDRTKILLEVDSSKLGWYDVKTGNVERIKTVGQPKSPICTGFLVGSLVSVVDDKLQSDGRTMPTLSIEIIANIISRLPVKLLLQFTIICKSWLSLIKSPSFIKRHLDQTLNANSNRHLILSHKSIRFAELDVHHSCLSFSKLDHPLKSQKVLLLGSCNGIVCISDYSINDVFMYNPLTKSYKKLPPNPIQNSKDATLMFGFGYDSKNDDYKVLRLLQNTQNAEGFYSEAKVYSLKNNLWKCVAETPYCLYFARAYFGNRHGVLVNDAIHYIVTTEELGLEKKLIASFDFNTEVYSLVDCPNYDDDFRSILDISELGGCLCLMVNYCTFSYVYNVLFDSARFERSFDGADLWVMREYGKKESWVRLFSISDPENIMVPGPIRTVVYSKDGRRILLEVDGVGLGWYDLETDSFEMCRANGPPEPPFETEFFMGSLVSLGDDKLHSEDVSGTMSKKNKKKKNKKKKNKKGNVLNDLVSAVVKLGL